MKRFSKKGLCLMLGMCIVLLPATLLCLYLMTAQSEPPQQEAPATVTTDSGIDMPTTQTAQNLPEEAEAPVGTKNTDALEEPQEEEPIPKDAILSFAGDVLFSEQRLAAYDRNGVSAIADSEMLSYMKESDLFIINEEFPFSLRGEPMADKQYTFRTDPKYVNLFQELGVDLVTLANNHTLDFGPEAFCDTLDTLRQAGIPSVGGGYNLQEASAPSVHTVNGQTFAVFGATRVSPSYDWYATDTQPGLFQTYDPTKLNAAILEASKTFDHVIVFVHWGIERNELPEDYQRALAKGYIDAGADLVVGSHPHILQGFEYYNGVPIVYSLGNYLFGNGSADTLLLRAAFSPGGELTLELIPCKKANGILMRIQNPSTLYQHLSGLSFDASISPDGIVSPKESSGQ